MENAGIEFLVGQSAYSGSASLRSGNEIQGSGRMATIESSE